MTRGHAKKANGITYLNWDGKTISNWVSALESAETLINLTGKSVDCRYTKVNKNLILSSRVDATQVLGKAIGSLTHPPPLWINASTATIYKHSLYKSMTEKNGEIGNDFSMTVAQKWEHSFYACVTPRTRKVASRISLVLGNSGGVYAVLNKLVQLGLGGKHGSGKQKFAWIHIQDLIRAFDFIIHNERVCGSVNITAPQTSSNEIVMQELRNIHGKQIGLPTPTFLLKIGSFFLRTEPELILKSRYVYPELLLIAGFTFRYPNIQKSIYQLHAESNQK